MSSRRCAHKKGKTQLEIMELCIKEGKDPPHFSVKSTQQKGRGVFANKVFERGDFLLVYHGELLSAEEGERREAVCQTGYRYFFGTTSTRAGERKQMCIDASRSPKKENGLTLGRLVNHGKKREINAKMKVVNIGDSTRLCLFALKEIQKGDEILYDYGIQEKRLPWNSEMSDMGSDRQVAEVSNILVSNSDNGMVSDTVLSDTCSKVLPATGEESDDAEPKIQNSEMSNMSSDGQVAEVSNILVSNSDNGMVSDSVLSDTCSKFLPATGEESDEAYQPIIQNSEMSNMSNNGQVAEVSNILVSNSDNGMVSDSVLSDTCSKVLPALGEDSDEAYQPIIQNSEMSNMDSDGQVAEVSNILVSNSDNGMVSGSVLSDTCSKVLPATGEESDDAYQPMIQNSEMSNMGSDGQHAEVSNILVSNSDNGMVIITVLSDTCSKVLPVSGEESDDAYQPIIQNSEMSNMGSDGQVAEVSNILVSNSDNGIVSDTVLLDTCSEFLPETGDESDDSYQPIPLKRRTQFSCVSEESQEEEISEEEISDDEDNCTVYYPPVQKKDQKRSYNKHQCCFYCSKLHTKISKHLLKKHSSELEVAKIAALPVNSRKRKDAFELLRNKGNFYHNKKVMELKKGELILVRRPTDVGCDETEFSPCPDCLGYFKRSDLWKHSKLFCKSRSVDSKTTRSSRDIKMESDLLLNKFSSASSLLQCVLAGMKEDGITNVVKQDPLIIELGNSTSRRCFGMDSQRRRHHVSQVMRTSAKLLQNLRTLNHDVLTLDGFLTTAHFDEVVEAVKMTAGQAEDGLVNHPSVSLKLGHILSRLATIKRCHALRRNDDVAEKEINRFIKLKDSEWPEMVSTEALNVMGQRKYNKVSTLPESTDLRDFSHHLVKETRSATEQLRRMANGTNFKRCSEVVLTRLTIFNKRRPGEMEQLKVSSYTDRPPWDRGSIIEVKKYLSSLECQLMKNLDMVYTRGKRGRKVPILIPLDCKEAMDCMVSCRSVCGVLDSNPYFFARINCSTHLRANDSIRDLTNEIPLKNAHLIRTTKMRKFTATVSQILDMPESEVSWLAEHLGHSLQVHRDFYRLSSPTLELTKVAKLLLAVDSGNTGNLIGKKLDEIQAEDIGMVEESAATQEGSAPCEQGHQFAVSESEEEMEIGSARSRKRSQPRVSDSEEEIKVGCAPLQKRSRTRVSESEEEMETECAPPQKRSRTRGNQKQAWSKAETAAVWNFFSENVKNEKVPGKEACDSCFRHNPCLRNRTWKGIKYKVKNIITSVKKSKR